MVSESSEAAAVPVQHLAVGQQVVRGQNRLGALQMRVGGNGGRARLVGEADERAL